MLNELRDALAQLYRTEESARRVVDEAGLPAVLIDFDGPILDVWHRIVRLAAARHGLDGLIGVASRDYPHSPVWTRLVSGAFRSIGSAAMNESSPVGLDEDKADALERMVWETRVEMSAVKVVLVALGVANLITLLKLFLGG